MPTVTQNLSELFDKELICINGTFDSTGGRKAKAIGFNADARFAIGIDITKNHISGVLINLYGEIVYSVRLRFRFEESDNHIANDHFPFTLEELNEYSCIILSDVGADTLLIPSATFGTSKILPNRCQLLKDLCTWWRRPF